MSFKAVTMINGEAHDGLINEIEPQAPVNLEQSLVRPSFKAEINMGTGERKSLMKGQVNAGDLRLSSEGVLKTASNNGFPVRNLDAINDKTIVSFNGVEMTARMAVEMGLLRKDGNGRYSEKKYDGFSDPSEDVHSDEPLTKATEAQMPEELFDAEVESALEEVSQDLGGYGNLDRHAASIAGGLIEGDITSCAKQLAMNIGREPEEAAAFITGVAERFRSNAANYITKAHGVDGNEVIEWVAANIPSQERSSMAYQVYLGQTGVLDRMADQFKGKHR